MKRIAKKSKKPKAVTQTDWDSVDSPALDAATLKRMRPASEVLPPAFLKAVEEGRVGRPKSANPKQAVSLRLDGDVLDAYRAQGRGWQTLVNAVLRDHMPV